jgi:hypothetical protein
VEGWRPGIFYTRGAEETEGEDYPRMVQKPHIEWLRMGVMGVVNRLLRAELVPGFKSLHGIPGLPFVAGL